MFAERFRFDDRHVVILGAGQGIGRAAARGAAELGARVTCVDLSTERAEAIAREIGGIALTADVTRRDAVTQVFTEAVESHGPVRHVLDVVGIPRNLPLPAITDEMWDFQFDIVLRHAMLAIQLGVRVNAVAPLLIATPRMKQLLGDQGQRVQSQRLAMGRLGEPDEVATSFKLASTT